VRLDFGQTAADVVGDFFARVLDDGDEFGGRGRHVTGIALVEVDSFGLELGLNWGQANDCIPEINEWIPLSRTDYEPCKVNPTRMGRQLKMFVMTIKPTGNGWGYHRHTLGGQLIDEV
jgi:hypothetical protein